MKPSTTTNSKSKSKSKSQSKSIASRQPLEGEGSYSATRRYNQHLSEHMEKADIAGLGDSARRALEGPEGPELRRAERIGKQPARTNGRTNAKGAKPARGKARGQARAR